MRNTKLKIKQKALELFNENGISDTTLRQIAGAMGISQGNLNYHYPTKKELIHELYFDLVAIINENLSAINLQQGFIDLLYLFSKSIMQDFYKYRFIMRDFYKILRAYPEIKAHYNELYQTRRQQIIGIFEGLIAQGLMREPEFEQEYHRLFERMTILGDNWINAAEIYDTDMKNPVDYYVVILAEIMYPYLTQEGKVIFMKTING
jgi:AcrR family transcriptional regulator